MKEMKFLEVDFQNLPMPVAVRGRDGRKKYYILQPSRKKTLGVCIRGIEEPLLRLIEES